MGTVSTGGVQHDALFASLGWPASPESDPVEVMNAVAQELPQWIQCVIDWSHHTLPQVLLVVIPACMLNHGADDAHCCSVATGERCGAR